MDALQALLSANLEIEQDLPIKRLGVNFRLKAVDTRTLEKAREQATQVSGSGSKRESKVDGNRLNAILVTKFCVSPDFGDKALIEKYGVSNAVDCVDKTLLPGEIDKIVTAGMKLSGFGDDEAEEDEIKN
jgi:hypothetical protein